MEATKPKKTRDEILREMPERQARVLKQGQLEREINESGATELQKQNMLHSLSKLGIFADEHANQAFAAGGRAAKEGAR